MKQQQADHACTVARVETFVFRAPADPPVRTSFGIMHDRPAVLVRVTDTDGVTGWGEIWCNFPAVGAEHRARLVDSVLAPLVAGRAWASPQACFETLTRQVHVLGIQTGEPGPLAQAIAGLDIALWDLVARRAGEPLWRFLGGSANTVSVYASGINPDRPQAVALAKADEGYRAFKLKVGFGDDLDENNLRAMRDALGADATLMIDANQAWTPERAAGMARRLAPYGLQWLEEPLPADTAADTWRALVEASPLPLAGGENLRGVAAFREAIAAGFAVIQPDLGKWGGFSACLEVGREALAHGQWFCPHWLGAGVGLRASMHLKAAIGGAGYVEVDSNPNPLRDVLAEPVFTVTEGMVSLPESPGLGVAPALDEAARYLVRATPQ